MASKNLSRLFEPINIGRMELKNRIKLPAMGIAFEEDASVSEQTKAFYAERTKGGVALIGISCSTTRLDKGPLYGIYDDRFIPGLTELVDTIHTNGAKVYAQMGVGYSWAFGDGPVEFISPSGVTPTGRPGSAFRLGGPLEPVMPRAISVEEIHQIVDSFSDGAIRAKQAGFDAVEVIASVSYIISQFLSPITNKRTDEYGGSFDNRMRFLIEIIQAIKGKTGELFPLTCRLSGADLMQPKGYDLEDTKRMARILEEAGVDQIDVMSGWHYASVPIIQMWAPQGAWAYLAEGVKSAVGIPVAAGTQIQDPIVAERVLEQGKADLVYMARALVADPEMPRKAKEGRFKDIRPCINCCRCISAVDNPPVYCSVNARMGREAEFPHEKPAAKSKNVLVVGGGPSGMEAARVASMRGHRVTLYDRYSQLGGALLLASVTNRRLEPFLKYMKRECRKLPIDIRLNSSVDSSVIKKMKPDVVVLALGGAAPNFNVPGSSNDIVLNRNDLQGLFSGKLPHTGSLLTKAISYIAIIAIKYFYRPSVIRWFLRFNYPFKRRVVVIGGNFAGCELADTLAERGKRVTIVEKSNRFGSDIELTHRWVFLDRLKKAGTGMIKNADVIRLTNKGLFVNIAGTSEFIEADTVVKIDISPNSALASDLKGEVPELYLIGDCADPARVMESVASGFLVGQRI